MALRIQIKVFHGETQVAAKDFEQDIIKIGRLATAHLKLDDQKVSRIHAVLEVSGGRDVSIIDMGSAEGTFVNGEKVNKVKLKDGDSVVVGETRLVVGIAAPTHSGRNAPIPDGSGVFNRTLAPTMSSVGMAAVPSATPPPASVPPPAPPPAAGARVPPPPPPGPAAAAAPAAPKAAAPARAPAPAAAAPVYTAPAASADEVYDDEEEGPWETEPEPVPDASRAVLEVQVRWGFTVIEVQHHDHVPTVTLGPGGNIHVDGKDWPRTPQTLFTCNGGSYALNVMNGMTGFVRTPKGIKDIKGGMTLPLSPDQSGELQIENMVLAFRFTEPRRKVAAAALGSMDVGWINTAMTTLFISGAFLATLILYPQDTKSLEEDLFQTNNRFTQFIINPEKKQKQKDFLAKLDKTKNTGTPAAAKGSSGKSGKPEAPKEKPAARAMTKAEKRAKDEEAVVRSMDKLFGGGASSSVFAASDVGGLENAMGGISGRQVGEAYGFGGLGDRGSGPGGGGASTSTFGVGRIGTRGRGGGQGGYGASGGGLGGRTERNIDISQGTPVILGSLDKEIIRRVIRENLPQIKYCYERELTRTPGLNGKVQVKFVIGANGNVQTATVAESSMNNKAAESCITGKVRGWVFPKPKGGGIVIVTYPFIFKQGG